MENNSIEEQTQQNTGDPTIETTKLGFKNPSVKKNLFILCGIVILVMAALITTVYKLYKPPVVIPGCNPGDTFSQTTGAPCNGEVLKSCQGGELFDRNTGGPCLGAEDANAMPEEDYQATLKTYSGKSIVFDGTCVPTPKSITVASNTKMLISNNSKKILEIIVPGRSVILPPYKSSVNSFSESGEFPVSCNGKISATINVK